MIKHSVIQHSKRRKADLFLLQPSTIQDLEYMQSLLPKSDTLAHLAFSALSGSPCLIAVDKGYTSSCISIHVNSITKVLLLNSAFELTYENKMFAFEILDQNSVNEWFRLLNAHLVANVRISHDYKLEQDIAFLRNEIINEGLHEEVEVDDLIDLYDR